MRFISIVFGIKIELVEAKVLKIIRYGFRTSYNVFGF